MMLGLVKDVLTCSCRIQPSNTTSPSPSGRKQTRNNCILKFQERFDEASAMPMQMTFTFKGVVENALSEIIKHLPLCCVFRVVSY